MTLRLQRAILVTTALVWLQVGMRLSHVATMIDAGGTAELSEWLVLVLLAAWGTGGVVALWQQPTTDAGSRSSAPSA